MISPIIRSMIHPNHKYFPKYLMFIFSLLLASGVVIEVGATTLARMDLAALARSAEMIVRARCIHSETKWESESISTFDDFVVLETLKGAPPEILRVRLPGGRVNHTEVKIEGVPAFITGEETILFVEKTSAGDYGITSWAQGTFRIHRETSGDARLTQDSSHFAVFDPHTRQFTTAGIRNIPLNDFRQQLAQAFNTPQPTNQRNPGSKK
nr:hypothetical protein [Candidatus Acidoferrales bacterium]